MNRTTLTEIESRLIQILEELERQTNVSATYPSGMLPFDQEMKQVREFIQVGEQGAAYELLVATIQAHPFVLSGRAAISLLEAGLLMGYKTERHSDEVFDKR